jgi:molybdopterin biosynthesis enzyme
LARIDATVAPAETFGVSPSDACWRVSAMDIVTPLDCPTFAMALIDGFAVEAAVTHDASSYAPVALAMSSRVTVGERLPPDTDAVVPFDAVQTNGERAEILVPVASGSGVLPAGGDVSAGTVLRYAGQQLRPSDIAVLKRARCSPVFVPVPRIYIATSRDGDTGLKAVVDMISEWIERLGGSPAYAHGTLENVLKTKTTELVIVVGGTGHHDDSVHTLARVGRIEAHGIGLTPGETTAFGLVDQRPVLIVPARLDAALAAFTILGRHIMARLTGLKEVGRGEAVTLSRKITSTIGLAEFIPLQRDGDNVTPLGTGYLSMQALARADGWLLVPPDSEGYPAGASVRMRAWP